MVKESENKNNFR